MQEAFLHHVWSLQYFSKQGLTTSQDEPVEIFFPGTLNRDAGPDFSQARMRIGVMQWIGNVEIHIRSSGWTEHRHDDDSAYDSVILHVVWQDDRPVKRRDGTLLPTIELRGRVQELLVSSYRQLVTSSFSIPCQRQFPEISEITKTTAFARSLTERLERRAGEVQAVLVSNGNNWEETAYQVLAGAYGFKINKEPFIQLARAMPLRILLRHQAHEQVEALVFGQAGFLDGKRGDNYYQALRKEYQLLSHKYQLEAAKLSRAQWLFLRLRPSNFPTLRLAQFCAVVSNRRSLFSRLLELTSSKEILDFLQAPVSSYWTNHYRFSSPPGRRSYELGRESAGVILVNTVMPLLVAYARYNDREEYMNRALLLLEELQPEVNSITRRWSDLGRPPQTAGEAQGQIELFNTFCREKRCLQCAIGAAIIRPLEDELGATAD